MFVSPERSLLKGNWIRANAIITKKISPRITANLFVAMNCFGMDFLIIWLMVSSLMYLYFGFSLLVDSIGVCGVGIISGVGFGVC